MRRDSRIYQFVNFQENTYPDSKKYNQGKIVLKDTEVDDLLKEIAIAKEKDPKVMLAITWDQDRVKPNDFGGQSVQARIRLFHPDPDWKPKAREPAGATK